MQKKINQRPLTSTNYFLSPSASFCRSSPILSCSLSQTPSHWEVEEEWVVLAALEAAEAEEQHQIQLPPRRSCAAPLLLWSYQFLSCRRKLVLISIDQSKSLNFYLWGLRESFLDFLWREELDLGLRFGERDLCRDDLWRLRDVERRERDLIYATWIKYTVDIYFI